MAWKIEERVIKGEIDNTVRCRMTGRFWPLGLDRFRLVEGSPLFGEKIEAISHIVSHGKGISIAPPEGTAGTRGSGVSSSFASSYGGTGRDALHNANSLHLLALHVEDPPRADATPILQPATYSPQQPE